jgi:RNA polymerase sigma factor (sigma-70 family)
MTPTARQDVDFNGVNSPPLLILWKEEQAAQAPDQPIVALRSAKGFPDQPIVALRSAKGFPDQPIVALRSAKGFSDHQRVPDGKKLMSDSDTRVSIIVGVCQRDPERWREFDAIYRPMLFAFLRKQRLNESDACDVVQDIFVKLLDKIHTYDRGKYRFRSWLFAVAHNTLIDKARRRASRKRAVQGWVVNVLRSTPSDSLKMAEEWVRIHRSKILAHALETVRARTSPRVWACFEQRLLRNRPGAEIAKELGYEPPTVYANAHRVLNEVRAVCLEFDEDLTNDDDESGLSRRD